MSNRGAFEINKEVRQHERQQLWLRATEWSFASRPARGISLSLPLRRWLAAALHGLAARVEPAASQWQPQIQD